MESTTTLRAAHQQPYQRSRWVLLFPPLVLVCVLTALVVRDPHQAGSWGACPTKALTGLDCPGCGSLRALNCLGHGDLLDMFHHNLLMFPALLLLAWMWVSAVTASTRHPVVSPRRFKYLSHTILALVVVFTVLRNLGGPFQFMASTF